MSRVLGLGLAIYFSISTLPASEPATGTQCEILTGVTKAELPAQVAALVRTCPTNTQAAVTRNVVGKAVKLSPTAAPAIVGAVAAAAPEMASIAAEEATRRQPNQAGLIAKAAAAAAPSQTRKIVSATCRIAPKQYRNIAREVAQAVPGSAKEIAEAIASVFPGFRASIEESLSAAKGKPVSIEGILDAANLASAAKPGPQNTGSLPTGLGPGMNRPPLIPLVGNPSQPNSPDPRDGRNYASP